MKEENHMDFQRFCVVAAGTVLLATTGLTDEGLARQRPYPAEIVIGVPLPPPIVIQVPPALVVVPGTNVYVAPDLEGDMLFHQGFWWWLYDGRWYRSRSYGGPWQYIIRERVPGVIFAFPPRFRYSYRNYHRLHHEEVMGNWQRWEHDRHWERPHNR